MTTGRFSPLQTDQRRGYPDGKQASIERVVQGVEQLMNSATMPTAISTSVVPLALHHVDDDGRVAFAGDALRALRPGGKVTVVDFGGPGSDAEDADHPANSHGHSHGPFHALRHLPRLMPSRVAHSPVVARNHGNGIVALLTDAGFGDAQEVAHADLSFGRATFVQATAP